MTGAASEYSHQHREHYVDGLKELLRIPSISTLPEHETDMTTAAEWLRRRLAAIGMASEVILTAGPPLVYAEWLGAPVLPTLLLYGHYDVQSVDPIELWATPPFEPEVRGGNIYARGASDDKGQTLTMVFAAESLMRAEGRLPINVKFLIALSLDNFHRGIETAICFWREVSAVGG